MKSKAAGFASYLKRSSSLLIEIILIVTGPKTDENLGSVRIDSLAFVGLRSQSWIEWSILQAVMLSRSGIGCHLVLEESSLRDVYGPFSCLISSLLAGYAECSRLRYKYIRTKSILGMLEDIDVSVDELRAAIAYEGRQETYEFFRERSLYEFKDVTDRWRSIGYSIGTYLQRKSLVGIFYSGLIAESLFLRRFLETTNREYFCTEGWVFNKGSLTLEFNKPALLYPESKVIEIIKGERSGREAFIEAFVRYDRFNYIGLSTGFRLHKASH